jgi:hypothetical protein
MEDEHEAEQEEEEEVDESYFDLFLQSIGIGE